MFIHLHVFTRGCGSKPSTSGEHQNRSNGCSSTPKWSHGSQCPSSPPSPSPPLPLSQRPNAAPGKRWRLIPHFPRRSRPTPTLTWRKRRPPRRRRCLWWTCGASRSVVARVFERKAMENQNSFLSIFIPCYSIILVLFFATFLLGCGEGVLKRKGMRWKT